MINYQYKKYIYTLGGGLIILSIVFLSDFLENSPVVSPFFHAKKEIINPLSTIDIRGKGVYVWDIAKHKVIFKKNAESQLPLASLTKLMTALVASENLGEAGTVHITPEDIALAGDSGLRPGEKWNVLELIGLMLTSSSNDGALALANASTAFLKKNSPVSFEELMNSKAQELGMNQTFFVNESGLDVTPTIAGSYGSPRDIAVLLEYLIRNHRDLFENTQYARAAFTSLSGIRHVVKNTNEIVERLPGILASKTGFTDLANGNLAIVFEAGPGHPIAVVVLGSTKEERFSDIEKLVWGTLAYLQAK